MHHETGHSRQAPRRESARNALNAHTDRASADAMAIRPQPGRERGRAGKTRMGLQQRMGL
jgi:hypothetical protein